MAIMGSSTIWLVGGLAAGKMMRKFKALKRSSIAKSTPSLNNLDFTEDTNEKYPSSIGSGYNQSDQQFDDNSSVLDGFIELTVLLPNGRQVRMPIHARTPMMDVLVQVTTANGINAGGMMLKVPIDRPPGYLHYKPNMPIGKLDCTSVEVVPKAAVMCDRPTRKDASKTTNLPFEPTIRIQVNLPKHQKTVLRINPKLTLREIFHRICAEANLRPVDAYELRSTKSTGFPLSLDRRLEEVGIVDFSVIPVSSCLSKSTNDILGAISRMSQEEKEKRKTKKFFGLLKRKSAAPQPTDRADLQKAMLDERSAVEVRSPEKPPRFAGKERPVSMNPVFLETSDGDGNAQQRDAAVKPKKRHAPPPPAVPPLADPHVRTSADLPLTSAGAPLRSHHTRRGSDSSSGYHGSSQPSPNPPAVSDTSAVTPSSAQNASGSEKSTFSYKSHTSAEMSGAKDDGVDIVAHKKKKAPMPPVEAVGTEKSMEPEFTQLTSPNEGPRTDFDSRCSSPATAEEVDKSFQEVIEHIEKQISDEDDATTATAMKPDRGSSKAENVTSNSPASRPQSLSNADPVVRKASELLDNGRPESFRRVDDSGANKDVSRPLTTRKPTNIDVPLVSSTEMNASAIDVTKEVNGTGNSVESRSSSSPTASHSLSLQTDGLLMVKSGGDSSGIGGSNKEDRRDVPSVVDGKKYLGNGRSGTAQESVEKPIQNGSQNYKDQTIQSRTPNWEKPAKEDIIGASPGKTYRVEVSLQMNNSKRLEKFETAKNERGLEKMEPARKAKDLEKVNSLENAKEVEKMAQVKNAIEPEKKEPVKGNTKHSEARTSASSHILPSLVSSSFGESRDTASSGSRILPPSYPNSARLIAALQHQPQQEEQQQQQQQQRKQLRPLEYQQPHQQQPTPQLPMPTPSPHQQHSATVNRDLASSPRPPTMVLHDPKRDLYPSMKVKSFEDEYYIRSQEGVAHDYVKAVRYGLVDEYSAGKEEREKNRGKLEAVVARKATDLAESQKPISPSGPSKAGETFPPVSSQTSIPPRVPSLDDDDDVSTKLQKEYEKLQAMFADWQLRLKQHETIMDTGRKIPPEQAISFQRFQDEMMEQHRFVQELCAQVQKKESTSLHGNSTTGQMVERLEVIKEDARGVTGSTATMGQVQFNKMETNRSKEVKLPTGEGRISATELCSRIVSKTPTGDEGNISNCPQPAWKANLRPIEKPSTNSLITTNQTSSKLAPSSSCSSNKQDNSSGSCIPSSTTAGSSNIPVKTGNNAVEVARSRLVSVNRHVSTSPANAPNKTALSLTERDNFGQFCGPSMTSIRVGCSQENAGVQSKYASAHSPVPVVSLPPAPIMPPGPPASAIQPSRNRVTFGRTPTQTASTGNARASGPGDPRGDLLASIRNFGGTAGLKQASTSDKKARSKSRSLLHRFEGVSL